MAAVDAAVAKSRLRDKHTCLSSVGGVLEAPVPEKSGLVKKMSPFSKPERSRHIQAQVHPHLFRVSCCCGFR